MKVEFDTKIRRGLPITVVAEVVRDELHPTFFVDDLQVLTRSGGSCAWTKLTPRRADVPKCGGNFRS